jgi:hypothetical protein
VQNGQPGLLSFDVSQGFCGLVLLAISGLSTIVNIMGALTLGMAWIGLVVYFVTGVCLIAPHPSYCGQSWLPESRKTCISAKELPSDQPEAVTCSSTSSACQ